MSWFGFFGLLISLFVLYSPVFLVFCYPLVFLCSSPHLSSISLISTVLFPVSLHLHLIPSLVQFVLKPVLVF